LEDAFEENSMPFVLDFELEVKHKTRKLITVLFNSNRIRVYRRTSSFESQGIGLAFYDGWQHVHNSTFYYFSIIIMKAISLSLLCPVVSCVI